MSVCVSLTMDLIFLKYTEKFILVISTVEYWLCFFSTYRSKTLCKNSAIMTKINTLNYVTVISSRFFSRFILTLM